MVMFRREIPGTGIDLTDLEEIWDELCTRPMTQQELKFCLTLYLAECIRICKELGIEGERLNNLERIYAVYSKSGGKSGGIAWVELLSCGLIGLFTVWFFSRRR